MILISLLILIIAIALPSFNKQLSPILITRITTILLIYSGALALNAFYIQSIGSGIGIYSGLFHITTISQQLDIFLLIIGALILIPRPVFIEYIKIPNNSSSSSSVALSFISLSFLKGNGTVGMDKQLQEENSKHRIISSEILSCLGDKYSLIILFSTLGSTLLLSSSDLLSMYLSIELQSFGVYILATLFKDSGLATSAGLKYFLLGGLSSCLILFGSGLVYFYTGLTNLESIYSLISASEGLVSLDGNGLNNGIGITLGIIIIVIGFLFKIAAAPLHNWAPDVYNDSPTIVTIWLTIMPKISILIFLLDLFIGGSNLSITDAALAQQVTQLSQGGFALKNLLLLSSLFSLIIGTVVGLAQSKIKRLLAYSTISHIGFLLLALSINSEQSVESFIFYIVQYSVTNLNTFLIILALGYLNFFSKFFDNKKKFRLGVFSENKNIEAIDIRFITELKGQFLSNPLLSLSLAICLFSMAGIPPLVGFFSKQMVLYSAMQSGYYFMSIVAILVSVISASYYLKIVRILFTTSTTHNSNPQIGGEGTATSPSSKPYGRDTKEGSDVTSDNNKQTFYPLLNNMPFVDVHNNYYISYNISNLHSFLISTLTLSILLFMLKPSLLLNSTQLLSLSLFYC